MHHAQRTSRAFTLVEILVVVVILGIAGAIIVPQMAAREDLRVSASARVLMSDLLYLQNLAITRQRNHYALFSTNAQVYSMVDGATMGVLTHPISKDPYTMRFGNIGTPGLRESSLLSAEFLAQSGGTAVTTIGFDELGTPVIYDSGTVQPLVEGSIILRSGNHKVKITVASFTGQLSAAPAN